MRSSYDRALAAVLKSEGGYSNDRGDPGGPTNWGITIADARRYWKSDATAADVRKMPLSIAKIIYREHYWDPLRGDDLPAGVDYAVFDYGVNSGVDRAAKVLQGILGVARDGKIGPKTLAAAKAANAADLVNKICDQRVSFLHRLTTWSFFGRGWTRRVHDVRLLALELAK